MASIVVYITDSNKIGQRSLPESFKKDWIPGARIKTTDGKEFCKILRIEESEEVFTAVPQNHAVPPSKSMLQLSKSDIQKKGYLIFKQTELELKISSLIDDYNANINLINEFVEDIKQRQENYFDARSENWQESDRGSDYECWKDEWESFSELDAIEYPDFVDIEEFENLPDSME
jgi:hypothetical protein